MNVIFTVVTAMDKVVIRGWGVSGWGNWEDIKCTNLGRVDK